MLKSTVIVCLLAVAPAAAQGVWFQPSLLERPDVRTALQSVDDRTAGIVDEWIKLTVDASSPSVFSYQRVLFHKQPGFDPVLCPES